MHKEPIISREDLSFAISLIFISALSFCVLFGSIQLFKTANAESVEQTPNDEILFDIWEDTRAEYPVQVQALDETDWTRLDSMSYELLSFQCLYETIIVIAKTAADADTKFAANQYQVLAAATSYSVQPRQGKSAYNIYAKCWAANDKSDTLDNAAAVDKSTEPETVGIPITGHSFVEGDIVTIAGSTNYNGTFRVYSKTANEIVIFAEYKAETFAGTETIVSAPTMIIKTGV